MPQFDDSARSIYFDPTITAEIADLESLLAGSNPDGIIFVDQGHLTVRCINDSGLRLLGVKVEEIIGKPLPLAIEGPDPQEFALEGETDECVHVSVHKQSIDKDKQKYWLLSLRDVSAIVQVREQLRSESIKDDLTGLLNRRGLVALGQHALSLAEREKRKLLVIFIDLDGMKDINDRFGHHRGDAALIDTANLLRRTFRKSDVLARLGGDEFAVIAQCKSDNDKAHIQRRLRENLEAIYKKAIGPYKLSLSVGMVEYDPQEKCGLDTLLERADAAMYEAKRARRGRLPFSETA